MPNDTFDQVIGQGSSFQWILLIQNKFCESCNQTLHGVGWN